MSTHLKKNTKTSRGSLFYILRNLRTSPSMQLLMLFVGMILIGLFLASRGAFQTVTLHIDFSTTATPTAQVFIPVSGAYSEQNSHQVELRADGERHTYQVRLSQGAVPDQLRFDPATGPSHITLYSIRIEAPGRNDTLQGRALRDAVTSLNSLQPIGSRNDAMELESTGTDPYLVVMLPRASATENIFRHVASWVLLPVGACLLTGLCILHRRRAYKWARGVGRQNVVIFSVLAALALLAVLTILGTGCERTVCSPRGVRLGAQLFLALIALALVGSAVFKRIGLATDRSRSPGLIAASLAGLVVVMAYIYIRSLLHAGFPFLPLTGSELWIVVAACAFYCARPVAPTPGLLPIVLQPTNGHAWLLIRLSLLAIICVVVADRELPRLAMLSSDPDSHAFLAKQLERMGGIYWSQGAWGPDPLRYPAGSAAMIFAWASLSFLDVGNALASLPLLLSLVASMAVGEALARRIKPLAQRTLLLLSAVGITSAGFLFPLYTRYAHLEGTGRQVSIAAIALLVVLALHQFESAPAERRKWERSFALLATLAFFVMAALNPINVLVPSILIAAYTVLVLVRERRLSWWILVPLACPLFLAMDPYYWSLMTGKGTPATFSIVGDYSKLGLQAILGEWIKALSAPPTSHLQSLLTLMPEEKWPGFALILSVLAIGWLAAGWKPARSAIGSLAVIIMTIMGLFLVTTLLQAVATDSRMYLMPVYFPFSVAQFKFMLLLSLSLGFLIFLAINGVSLYRLAICSSLIVCVCFWTLRPAHPMHLTPRHAYCGSMGCIQPTDIEIVKRLESLVAAGGIPQSNGRLPRILVPNMFVSMGNERWIFPMAGSRYLAMADALPVAFYYYQGDSIYTTENYKKYVCDQLDREWLAKEGIQYVFLPAERQGTCIDKIETLRITDTILMESGNSSIIRLRTPTR